MTPQQIFDKALTGIRAQGGPSVRAPGSGDGSPGGRCRYRGDKGRMCAVGLLISDDAYSPGLEEAGGADTTPVIDALRLSGIKDFILPVGFLLSLQRAHDESSRGGLDGEAFFALFEPAMQLVASNFGLKYEDPK